MAIRPITPESYAPDPCGAAPTIYFGTASVSGPLFLVGTFTTYGQERNFKYVRGTPILCGLKLRLWQTFCIAEIEGGNGRDHIFQLPSADPGSVLWYVISDSCRSDLATGFTHIIRYEYASCIDTLKYAKIENNRDLSIIANNVLLDFPTFVDGNPNIVTDVFIEIDRTLPVRAYCTGQITTKAFFPSDQLFTVKLCGEGEDDVLAEDSQQLKNGESWDFVLSGTGFCPNSDWVGVRITATPQPMDIFWEGSEHPCMLVVSQESMPY